MALPFGAAGLIAPLFGGKPVFLQIISLGIQALFLLFAGSIPGDPVK